MAEEFKAFVDHVAQIEHILAQADAARRLPAERAGAVRRIEITTSGYNRLTEAQKIIGRRMLEVAEAEERRAGEIARDRELRRLAVELDVLRQPLAELASKAKFDLLDTVREMRS